MALWRLPHGARNIDGIIRGKWFRAPIEDTCFDKTCFVYFKETWRVTGRQKLTIALRSGKQFCALHLQRLFLSHPINPKILASWGVRKGFEQRNIKVWLARCQVVYNDGLKANERGIMLGG